MPQDIQQRPKLLIVSDTVMWNLPGKGFAAFEPVVREIEHFAALFSEITWIGYEQKQSIMGNARDIKVPVNMVFLPQVGGSGLINKTKILFRIPVYAFKVIREILKAEVIHTRAPSLPAFIAILFSLLDRRRIYWHKYAGNWKDKAPAFYALQRWILKKAIHTKVTINGYWPGQKPHLLNFENPCFTQKELEAALIIGRQKKFDDPIVMCFIGNMTSAKGILLLLEAFEKLCINNPDRFFELHIAGDGILRFQVENRSAKMKGMVKLYGFLNRIELSEIYARAHLLCLPSKSEGFPKVVAEAAAYGCIPVVSDVSSIGQHIQSGSNGFLINDLSVSGITTVLERVTERGMNLEDISNRTRQLAHIFTYERYCQSINKDILKNSE